MAPDAHARDALGVAPPAVLPAAPVQLVLVHRCASPPAKIVPGRGNAQSEMLATTAALRTPLATACNLPLKPAPVHATFLHRAGSPAWHLGIRVPPSALTALTFSLSLLPVPDTSEILVPSSCPPFFARCLASGVQTRNQEVCVGSTCIDAENIEVIPPKAKRSVVAFL